jgi:hypothetical protein
MKFRHCVSVVTIAAAALLLAAPLAHAGDQAEDKSKTSKAKHVYTDEDMPSTREDAKPSDAPADKAGAKPEEEKLSAADAQKEYDETDRAEKTLRMHLDELQKKADATDSQFRKQMYLDSIEHQQVTLQGFVDKKKKLKEQIDSEKEKKQGS